MVTRHQHPVRDPLLARWLPPQDYSADRRYRPPSRRYGRVSRWLGVPLTSLGLAPRYAVTLSVAGRRTGKPRRNPVLITPFDGEEYLVALAGESEWVRNVRAAQGVAVLHRRGTRRVLLEEVPLEARARVLAAYQAAGALRSGPGGARVQARCNFGLGSEPTLDDFERLAPRYPVFRVTDRGATAGARTGSTTDIAPGVFCIGPWGRTATTAYLVTTPSGWVLLDAGWAGDVERIRDAAAGVYGAGSAPTAILLTHAHPDHSGAARALARAWGCPVYLHPAELPIATGDFASMHEVAGPLDRWLVLPVMRLMSRRRRESVLRKGSLAGLTRPLHPGEPLPVLPGWEVIATPGHTPGHLSFLRSTDRVLVSGDALVTVELNSVSGLLRRRPGLSAPPWYSTWNRAAAASSVRRLSELDPTVLAGGHGTPLSGPDTARRIRQFARHYY